jgi:tetratricopeptide (TPR) repeat protein
MNPKAKGKATAAQSDASAPQAGEMPGMAAPPVAESTGRLAVLNDHWTVFGVCIFLAVVIWLVFGQTVGHEFINFDDDVYVYENPEVAHGLTLNGIVRAFSHVHSCNWHPLTWISHMLDCQFYGLNPGGHHFTNILIHTVTAVLLFLVLRQMTGALWRSAFVAAVFAIHPLRVESVAWVAERKDVLSGLFFMLTLWAYVSYARRPWSPARYGLVVVLFALGLMCKPMLVTLPFVLLLLDYWPLRRFAIWRLIAEKVPLLVLSGAVCVITFFAQREAISSFEQISLPLRVGNGLISCVAYMGQMFWPSGLAVVYPFAAGSVGISRVVVSLVLLAGISTGVFVLRRHRYLLTGWLWYFIMLGPVIGILQVGWQSRADRYTYLPQIGLYVLLTWAAADLSAGWRHRRLMLCGFSTVVLVALVFCARKQTSYWQNSGSLWTHALDCTHDNTVAHNNLGDILAQKGKVDEAIGHFREAIRLKPDYAEAHYNLGNVLFKKDQTDEAISQFQEAIRLALRYAEAHNNLGNVLFKKDQTDEAIRQYQDAIRLKPDNAEAHNNLGTALGRKGQTEEAIRQYQDAIRLKPDYVEAHFNLGNVLFEKDQTDEAISQFQEVIRLKPDDAEAHINLGSALVKKGQTEDAIRQYQEVIRLNPEYADAHYNLGSALMTKGQTDEAIRQFQEVIRLKPDDAEAHNNLGSALLRKGRTDEAIRQFQEVIRLKPDSALAHFNLGYALVQKRRVDEAIGHFQEALKIQPGFAEAHRNLGYVLLQTGHVREAVAHFETVLKLQPYNARTMSNLAWVLATCPQASVRNGSRAMELARKADRLSNGQDPVVLRALAAAYAEGGRFAEAVTAARRALELAESHSNAALADTLRSDIKLYQADSPFRDTVQAPQHAN